MTHRPGAVASVDMGLGVPLQLGLAAFLHLVPHHRTRLVCGIWPVGSRLKVAWDPARSVMDSWGSQKSNPGPLPMTGAGEGWVSVSSLRWLLHS